MMYRRIYFDDRRLISVAFVVLLIAAWHDPLDSSFFDLSQPTVIWFARRRSECANIIVLPEKPFMRVLMAAAACALFLSACGIKGPLYLPSVDPVPTSTPPAKASPIDSPAADRSE
jgi:predicted small lipoprotein YifL